MTVCSVTSRSAVVSSRPVSNGVMPPPGPAPRKASCISSARCAMRSARTVSRPPAMARCMASVVACNP
uniref:Uncharacterized protein n=1 Tax=uncultured marine virus TaxID=186617 RepID=A0A0F7L9P7_9VIRU|nr:hypothetical protein [uncultured marine virus]